MRIIKMRKGTWTKEEDELLSTHVQKQINRFKELHREGLEGKLENLKIDWVEVSASVKTRTGKQCRERWINHLNPSLKKGQWTPEEDEQLLLLGEKFPSKWAIISRKMEGRSQNQVKIRWNTLTNVQKKGLKRKHQDSHSRPTGHNMGHPYSPMNNGQYLYGLLQTPLNMQQAAAFQPYPFFQPLSLYGYGQPVLFPTQLFAQNLVGGQQSFSPIAFNPNQSVSQPTNQTNNTSELGQQDGVKDNKAEQEPKSENNTPEK